MCCSRSGSIVLVVTMLALAGCGDDDGAPADGSAGGGDAGTGGGMDGSMTTGDGSTPADGTVIPGDGAPGAAACSNGLDDDGDGLADGLDPECSGPADNDEGTFGTGIPGDNRDPDCQDCFFDGNSGAGDDGCNYATTCLTTGLPTSGHGICATCEPTAACVDYCRARTPNGCDCFGCCTVTRTDGSTVDILLGGTCSEATLDDTTACPRCMKSTMCENTCGRCELCLGRTVADLPADCTPDGGVPDGGVPYVCDPGIVPCDTAGACPAGYYCTLGCCILGIF